jgi:hypothetical protein
VGPTVGPDAVAKIKKDPYPCQDPNSGSPSRSLVTTLTELSRFQKYVQKFHLKYSCVKIER